MGRARGSGSRRGRAAPVAPAADGDVVVRDRVVTLAGWANGWKRRGGWIVPRAVVTPALRDELRRRKIVLAFEEPRPTPASAAGDRDRPRNADRPGAGR